MPQRHISFHYTLSDLAGKILESSIGGEPVNFIEGARQIIPGLESQLLTLNQGEKKRITVLAGDAYGMRNESLVMKVGQDRLPAEGVKIGDQFQGEHGDLKMILTVTEISGGDVTLDGNHPFAGQDLVFDVEVTEVREASEKEIQASCCSGKSCESGQCADGCGSGHSYPG